MQDFSTGLDSDTDPLIEVYVTGTEICPWDGDPFLKCVQKRLGKGSKSESESASVQWKKFCIVQCNNRVWNPSPNSSPNPTPLVEISHK